MSPKTDMIQSGLSERLERESQPGGLAARLREIGEHCAALPDHDTRTPDEIVGYVDTGMWR